MSITDTTPLLVEVGYATCSGKAASYNWTSGHSDLLIRVEGLTIDISSSPYTVNYDLFWNGHTGSENYTDDDGDTRVVTSTYDAVAGEVVGQLELFDITCSIIKITSHATCSVPFGMVQFVFARRISFPYVDVGIGADDEAHGLSMVSPFATITYAVGAIATITEAGEVGYHIGYGDYSGEGSIASSNFMNKPITIEDDDYSHTSGYSATMPELT